MQASAFPRMCRAWNLDTKEMLYPEQLITLGFSISPDGLPVYRDRPFPVVIMWFSGHYDKNKKPIYEGDICKMEILNDFGSVSIDYGIMRWNKNTGGFMFLIPSAVPDQVLNVRSAELIGDEFRNDELIPLLKNEKHIKKDNG